MAAPVEELDVATFAMDEYDIAGKAFIIERNYFSHINILKISIYIQRKDKQVFMSYRSNRCCGRAFHVHRPIFFQANGLRALGL